ncbi:MULTISPECIES: DeoR/GlpR family DNA-binding transcription regulator [Pedobacter]|jgi:DeoR family transcriptional regulator of aga operon|uniref:DeoR family transcriptional regulator n=2 Tax=Pedobacter TaxID=84567 RepID=A0A7K0FRF7_9SPHI|nr:MULTISPECIES: DeoR/GlpR family DNA-binding transcription regulator [Pedobacter]KHJ39045.1 glucitol operon repressor [Pedobacter glucosidilyticus]MRX48574.1 DeoR family transcriptional regulator [Pedobacter puniceum]QEK52287.1 DeoR/GlpR transcriptional regulator [Pedobacter aquae]
MINIAERHQFILNKLQKEEYIAVVDLCKELDVSPVTIRKDLKLLEEKNLLFKTHGGATLQNPYTIDRPVNEKEKIQSLEKVKIASTAAGMIQENDALIIASGTTVLALARAIPANMHLTVVTAALNVALELTRHQNIEVLQLGGLLRKSSSSVTGSYAETILKDFFCNKLFLGVDGIDLEFGLTTTSSMEAQLNREMIKVAQKTIVLADSTKFGKRGFGKICPIDEIDHIITDSGISASTLQAIESMGIHVTVV